MRRSRSYVLGATALVVGAMLLAACGSGGDGSSSGSSGDVASQFILGGPAECPKAPYCEPGLKKTYGLSFKDFVPLDSGGPQTVAAISSGKVQLGELFSTSSAIAENDFVVLEDDKHLQAAGNIVPVIRKDVDSSQIDSLLNAVSAKITDDNITQLNKQVEVDHKDPADVAKSFLDQQGLLGGAGSCSGSLTVGTSGAFAESQIMAAMYAVVLEDAGCSVDTQLNLQSRQVSDKALFAGDIDLKPEYVAYEYGTLEPKADTTGTAGQVLPKLKQALAKENVNVLDFTPANDTNAFAVTKQTAGQYNLQKMSDLAKPAP